jgi:hypothetical protein
MFGVQPEHRHEEPRWSGRDVYFDLALIFLLLRLRRRTRFFLHLALIFVDGSRLKLVSQLPEDESLEGEGGQYSHCCEDESPGEKEARSSP